MVTLSGFIAADVSQTPHGPCSHPTATASCMNPDQSRPAHTQTHTRTERVRWRQISRGETKSEMEQEKNEGDEADCVGELSVCVCERD